jgi:hypothetical protein
MFFNVFFVKIEEIIEGEGINAEEIIAFGRVT